MDTWISLFSGNELRHCVEQCLEIWSLSVPELLILRVAVAAPLPGLFDYLPPPGVEPARLQRGVRLRVPFGRGSRKRYRKSATGMRWKMIRWITERKEFLFDLKNDPRERKNVLHGHPDITAKLRKHLDRFLERNAIDTLDLE